VHVVVEVLVRENVSSMVPAAPSDPYTTMWSCDGWHVVAVVVLGGEVVVVVGAVVVVVVGETNGLLVQAPSTDPTTRAAHGTAATRFVIFMTRPLPVSACLSSMRPGRSESQGRTSRPVTDFSTRSVLQVERPADLPTRSRPVAAIHCRASPPSATSATLR